VRIELQQVGKRLGGRSEAGHPALRNVSLEVPEGSLLVLVGPSGAGKSTLLRIIAGLERGDEGRLLLKDAPADHLPAHQRDLVFTPQFPVLFPHLTVAGNILLSLRQRGHSGPGESERMRDAAVAFRVDTLLDRLPHQLSGGELQRAALARAFALRPGLFLLDEPLANIDAALRQELRGLILDLQQRLGATMILVTHDQQEAMSLGGTMAMLNAGEIAQSGTAQDLYDRPRSVFVASFLGVPGINLIPGFMRGGEFETSVGGPAVRLALGSSKGPVTDARVILGLRPEVITAAVGEAFGAQVACQVVRETLLGAEVVLELETPLGRLNARVASGAPRPSDSASLDLQRALWFDGATGQALPVG
jgi:ABC-type sugar transport system ATPase subunit